MAEVFIAAAPGEDAQARGLAEALGVLGFNVASGTPAEADIAKTAEDAKCILVLWSRPAATAPWLTALAVLAQERKKLVSAHFQGGITPEHFKGGPNVDLAARDRNGFKARFQALITELDKVAPTTAKADAMPDALVKARAALLHRPDTSAGRQLRTLGFMAAGVAVLFAVGFGAGRVINMARSGQFVIAMPRAEARPTSGAGAAEAAAPVAERADASLTVERLQRESWQDVAASLDDAAAADITRRAGDGDAVAQTYACIGHMAGAQGFLPSPTAAREQCDAASEQRLPAALYLSWQLRRTAPHSGITEATARARLAEAARMGWGPAQIDYAQLLSADRSIEAQAEAGRLFLAAAERNDARGQYFYAKWLRDSPAGPRDPTAAIPFLERAANRSQVDAQHMLATLYRDGIGIARNEGRAKALYEQAARQGYPPSMFNLADMLRSGTEAERARAVALYAQLACMRDERQIQPMAAARLRALRQSATCR